MKKEERKSGPKCTWLECIEWCSIKTGHYNRKGNAQKETFTNKHPEQSQQCILQANYRRRKEFREEG